MFQTSMSKKENLYSNRIRTFHIHDARFSDTDRLARMGTLSGTYKNSIAPFVLLLVCKMINKCASFHPYLQDLRMHQTENKTCVKLISGLFDATNRGHFSKP